MPHSRPLLHPYHARHCNGSMPSAVGDGAAPEKASGPTNTFATRFGNVALAPTSRSSTSHRGAPRRRNKEELQRTTVDRQPLLPGKLFIEISRRDLAAAVANYKHVSPRALAVRLVLWSVPRMPNVTKRTSGARSFLGDI